MKIQFKKIVINNFMSLGDISIDLDNQGYTLVSGINNNPSDLAKSNGSGKSSIFEAIVWCLTGETMRGNKDITNNVINKGTRVTLYFNIDNNSYKLIRTKDDPEYKTNLLIYINDEDKSGKGIRDSDKLLKEYIPDLTPSLIGSVIVLGQGLPTRFTNNSPSGRKEVLEKLCKSDFMIEDLKDRVGTRKTALQSTLRTHEDNLLSQQTILEISYKELDVQKNLLKSLNEDTNYNKLIQDLTTEITNNKTLLDEVTNTLDVIDNELNVVFQEQSSLNKKKKDSEDTVEQKYVEQITTYQNKINELSVSIGVLTNKIKDIKSIKEVCPTCGQRLPNVNKPSTESFESELNTEINNKQKYTEELNNLLKEKELEEETITKSFQEIQVNLSTQYKTLEDKRTFNSQEKNKLTTLINSQNSKLTEFTLKQSNLETNIRTCEEKIDSLNRSIKEHEDTLLYNNNVMEDTKERLSIINKFNTVLSRDFRGYLLESIVEFINSVAKKYCLDVFETDYIEFKLDGNNIAISYNNKQYESLSGGERQKIDIILQLALRDMLCKYTDFSTNLLVLDEIFDNLDELGCSKIIDLISNKLNDISSIYIISHHGDELNIPSDNELIVVKECNGVSYIK